MNVIFVCFHLFVVMKHFVYFILGGTFFEKLKAPDLVKELKGHCLLLNMALHTYPQENY